MVRVWRYDITVRDPSAVLMFLIGLVCGVAGVVLGAYWGLGVRLVSWDSVGGWDEMMEEARERQEHEKEVRRGVWERRRKEGGKHFKKRKRKWRKEQRKREQGKRGHR